MLKTEEINSGEESRFLTMAMVESDGEDDCDWRDATTITDTHDAHNKLVHPHPRRWSEEEDERLRTAVEKHDGMNWKEIAAEVETRNHVQCLQRWKKVLTPGLVKGQWSRDEDDLLTKLVGEGHKNWGALAARIPGRTSKQCRERWCHHLDPRIVKGEWTEEEDRTLVTMHDEIGNKWATIAQHLNGRTENATKIRWKILERNMRNGKHLDLDKTSKLSRGNPARHSTDGRMRCLAAQAAASAMSKAKQAVNAINPIGMPENPTVVQDVLEQNFGDTDLSRKLPFAANRIGNSVRPSVSQNVSRGVRTACTASTTAKPVSSATSISNGRAHDNTANQEQQQQPAGKDRETKKRKMTGGYLQPSSTVGETTMAVSDSKDYGLLMGDEDGDGVGLGQGEGHSGRRGWLPDEDARLRQAVEKYGDRNWRHVAQNVGTRTHIQCQQRWKKALRPGLIKGAWSLEEDENLVTLIGQGFPNWSELAAHTPGRTAKQCRERWCHHLDPSVNHGSWTEEEDILLCSLETRLGTKWAAIAREMPGRTEHAVKGRFKTLMRESRVFDATRKGHKAAINVPKAASTINASTKKEEVFRHHHHHNEKEPTLSMAMANGCGGMTQHLPLEEDQGQGQELEHEASSSAEVMQFKFGLAQLSPASACMTSAGACPASATATIAASASATLKDNVKAENDSETGGCPSGPSIARLLSVSSVNAESSSIARLLSVSSSVSPESSSIARMLSVSSVGAESSATLPEDTSGLCGSGLSTSTTINGNMKRKMKETAFTGTAPSNGIGVAQAQAQARANALHVRTHTRAGARTELGSQTWHQNQGNQGGPSREDLGATNFQDFSGAPSTVPPGGSSCSSSAMGAMGVMGATLTPSLAGRPCRRDYSDLASILMDSAPREQEPLNYIPAWGGFCSWGISREDWWTAETLGPDTDPNYWVITDDGVLHFFRSALPKKKFMGKVPGVWGDIPGNIRAGNDRWISWWGKAEPGTYRGPFNTACFCSADTCLDA